MSRSFGESYRVGSASGAHAITVFCSWDHKVTQKRASRLQRDNIRTQLKVIPLRGHCPAPASVLGYQSQPTRRPSWRSRGGGLGLLWGPHVLGH